MSKIYDALIKAGEKRRHSRVALKRDEPRLLPLSWQNLSVEWKVMGVASVMLVVLGSMSIVSQLRQALRTQIDKRALIIATNLSDAAAGHVIRRNVLELHALVTKYARLEGSAYAFVEDGNGQIVAHSSGMSPAELIETLTVDDRREVNRRVISLQGKTVYETRTPILEGQVGVARVGVWGEGVETEIYSAVLPIVALFFIVFLTGVTLSVVITRVIIRPIQQPTASPSPPG